MKRISQAMKAIGVVVVVGLISWFVVFASNQINRGTQNPVLQLVRTTVPTRPAYCVPIPHEAQIIGTPTPTPNRYSTSIPSFRPSVTPIPFAHIYDLSPELPLGEKSHVLVYRCDGSFDMYLAAPSVDVFQVIELGVGDIIIGGGPPTSMMGYEPPEPPGSEPTHLPSTSIATSLPYPPPETPIDTTPVPYPYPLTSTPGNPEP